MERGNSGKLIAIVALVIGVVGLSVGFAAYSSTLNITSNANVEVTNSNDWNVGFGDATEMAGTTVATAKTVNGTTSSSNNGTLRMQKYTLEQGTAATLQNTNGSSVTYAFKIRNDGSIAANLGSIASQGITCRYNPNATGRTLEGDETSSIGKQVTPNADAEIANCANLFDVTLTINGTDYNLKSLPQSFTGTIAAGASVDASLTIARNNATSVIVDGDFIVTLGDTTVVYGS